MVIGAYAVIHHSRPRYTGDLDLWIDSSLENAERVVTALQEFGFPPDAISNEMIPHGRIFRSAHPSPKGVELKPRIASACEAVPLTKLHVMFQKKRCPTCQHTLQVTSGLLVCHPQ